MRKTILIVLLVLLAFTIWSVLAFGKAKKGEEARQPVEIEKAEPGPAPEDFPKVVLPREHKVRPTDEDFKNMLMEKKSKAPEEIEALQGETAPVEFESQPQKAPYFCEVRNQHGGAYYRPGGDWNLYCWGQLGLATLLNLDDNYWTDCPYPLYPFEVTDVAVQVYASNVCTIISEGRIYTVDYLTKPHGCAYPDVRICEGGPQVDAHPGAFLWIVIPVDPPCCVYDEFFVAWMFNNSDDFNDVDYCEPTQFVDLSLIFDGSGRECQSFWGPYAEYTGEPYYGWFDVVPNGLWPGALRIEVLGYTADQNTCPDPVETWYWKDAFDDYPDHYAPSGLPDFYQYQGGFPNAGMAYCGPTAGANSIWWFAASSQLDPSWGGWEPDFPPLLIQEVAEVAGTDPYLGTECDNLQKAILEVIKAHGGWWYYETTVYYPDFWYIQKELRACEDVILLLGFWQLDPSGEWYRFGGHFVTLAGIDIFNWAFAFSDPAIGFAENAGMPPPFVGAGNFIVPHDPLPGGVPPPAHENAPVPDPPAMHPLGWHNDAGNVSHDPYWAAWPSPSPGGFIWLPEYIPMDSLWEPVWYLFQDQNFREEHLPFRGEYNPTLFVYVEIEQAIVVSPGPKEMSDCVHSSRAYECENNHGGVEAFGKDFGEGLEEAMYYGSLIVGTSQEDLQCDYGDYYPLHTFNPLGPPVCTSFTVDGTAGTYTIEQCTYEFDCPKIPGLKITKYAFGFWVPVGGADDCEQVVEDVFILENTGAEPIIGLEKAFWLDWDIDPDYMDLSDGNAQYQSVWMWNPAAPEKVFGMTKKPADGTVQGGERIGCCQLWDGTNNTGCVMESEADCRARPDFRWWCTEQHCHPPNCEWNHAITGYGMSQAARVYDGQYMDSLKYWMENLGWGDDNPGVPEDRSIILASVAFDLPAGAMHIEKYNKWGYHGPVEPGGDENWRHFLYRVMHQEGFYRGDVNQDGKLNVSDVIYEINYLFKGGPEPIEFVSQGDVDCDEDEDISDVIYKINYLFKGGPAPIDKNRAFLESPFVDPAHKDLGIINPGLFASPEWRDLGN